MKNHELSREEMIAKVQALENRLWEAEQTLEAIRNGEVDAIIVRHPDGEQLYTLRGADHGYRVLVECITEGAFILSSDDSIYYCNRALGEMLGVAIQKITNRKLDAYVAPESRPELTRLIGVSRNVGTAKGGILIYTGGGKALPVAISLNRLTIEDFEGLCGIITDLSQQKKVEEELRRHRTELKQLIDERTSDLARSNAELQKEISWREQIEEELRESHERLEVLVQERTEELRRANEELKAEIREREHIEGALRKSEERFRSLVTASSQIVWTADPQGRGTSGSAGWQAFTGQSEEEMQNHNWSEMIHPDDRQTILKLWKEATESASMYEMEFRLRRYDGQYRNILARAVPVFEQDGSLREWVGTCSDITEQKRYEEALQKSEKRLRFLSSRLLTAQEEERKSVARELHDSIGSSLAALKLGISNALDQKGKHVSGHLLKSLEALHDRIQMTIEETRRIYMALRPSILDDLGIIAAIDWFCRNFHLTYSDIHIEKRIEVEEEDIPEPIKIVIFRIIQEAINNVAKYSKAELVNLVLARSEEAIELSIEDNGVGFDVDLISAPRNDDRGLGLTSMRERAELSGGYLAIHSVVGEGTVIRAFWPLQE